MRFFRYKRLKIVEQITVVVCFAVVAPLAVSGFIINNANQHAIRNQLRDSAVMISNIVSDEIDFFSTTVNSGMKQVASSLKYIQGDKAKQKYLDQISKEFNDCEKITIANNDTELKKIQEQDKQNKKATVFTETDNGKYVVATYDLKNLRDEIFQSLKDDEHQIYVMSEDDELIAAHNYTDETFKETMEQFPKNPKYDEPQTFGKIKNRPFVYVKKKNPPITIIVNTTETISNDTIGHNRNQIFWTIIFAMVGIISIIALYTYYLYINIRQLFKGIIAISKGNYERQIRLLTTAFTPHEIVFLAFEFNRMAGEIHKSYLKLKQNNIELEKLNEFRSNLIDTVSHELRTPLTSIQGYTSRLMRQDITIDEETKQKSLRIIKEQSERLKHLIEDLLTIPDIEGMRLKTDIDVVWLPEVLETAKLLVKNKNGNEITINIDENFPNIFGDKNRLEQVFCNLIGNATKYAYPETEIIVNGVVEGDKAKIYVKNRCDIIPEKKLNILFDKFVRLDNNTTRTTRGTGLGLFIVKGLIEAMNGKISLSSDEEYGFTVEIELSIAPQEATAV